MTTPLGHLFFFLPSTSASHIPFIYTLCLILAAIVTSPEQEALLPKAAFLCAQNSGNLIAEEQLQEAQVSTPLEAAMSKTETNCNGTSISLQLK